MNFIVYAWYMYVHFDAYQLFDGLDYITLEHFSDEMILMPF